MRKIYNVLMNESSTTMPLHGNCLASSYFHLWHLRVRCTKEHQNTKGCTPASQYWFVTALLDLSTKYVVVACSIQPLYNIFFKYQNCNRVLLCRNLLTVGSSSKLWGLNHTFVELKPILRTAKWW